MVDNKNSNSNLRLFEKRENNKGYKSTAAPANDISNYLSGNVDSTMNLNMNNNYDTSAMYDERSFVHLNKKDEDRDEVFNKSSIRKSNMGKATQKEEIKKDKYEDPYTLADALKTNEINQIYKDTFPY